MLKSLSLETICRAFHDLRRSNSVSVHLPQVQQRPVLHLYCLSSSSQQPCTVRSIILLVSVWKLGFWKTEWPTWGSTSRQHQGWESTQVLPSLERLEAIQLPSCTVHFTRFKISRSPALQLCKSGVSAYSVSTKWVRTLVNAQNHVYLSSNRQEDGAYCRVTAHR